MHMSTRSKYDAFWTSRRPAYSSQASKPRPVDMLVALAINKLDGDTFKRLV